jgi:dUTP pyrophosphatase
MKMEFKKVSRFADADFNLPVRKTKKSAGYDFEVAEDIVIPSFYQHFSTMLANADPAHTCSLEEAAKLTKELKAKPTLVSTGVKCYLKEGYYLELSVRSSTPLKYWLILANSVGIIDGDYADNPDNEGEIFFQIINLSPFPIALKKGDIIGQGVLKRYGVVDGDSADGARIGGLGSTTSAAAMAVDNAKELSLKRDMLLDETYFDDTEKIKEDLAKELEKALYGGQSLFDACM